MPDLRPKQFNVVLSDPTGTQTLGVWPDTPVPTLRTGLGGLQAWQFNLPRQYGRLDEPGESGSTGTLAWGNRLDVLVSDATTQAVPVQVSAVGRAAVGTASVGVGNGLGTLIWRGSIEQWDATPPAGVSVSAVDLGRMLDGTFIVGTYNAAGDPVVIARAIVQQYLLGMTWDTRNPNTCGVTVTVQFINVTVRAALEGLRDLCGVNWLLTTTPRGTVRLFQPDTSVATHTLTAGIHTTDANLTRDGTGRRKRMHVVYAGGTLIATATAHGYNPADPRMEIVSADHLTTTGDALRLAQLLLTSVDRIVLRGTCTVTDTAYDIESIQIGDTVRLVAERPLGAVSITAVGRAAVGTAAVGFGGYQDYAGQNLVVTAVERDLYTAKLELSQPQPRQQDRIMNLSRQLAAHLAKG